MKTAPSRTSALKEKRENSWKEKLLWVIFFGFTANFKEIVER